MNISTKRHSLAHVLAQAIEEIYGKENVKLWFGPDIENWFYHDFDLWEIKISDADLKDIEKKMKAIISQNQKFEKYELSIDEAINKIKYLWDNYRLQNLEKLKIDWIKTISFYKNTNQNWKCTFDNLCSGPHIENTNKLDKNAFCLEKVAWAYWLGDSANPMLTRIYWLAFDTREELESHQKMLEEARKRDHRILWDKLKLFTISKLVWAWLPLIQPAWMIIRKEIEDYLWNLHKNLWYSRVWTPHLAKEDLYCTSWHAEKFWDEIFKVKWLDDNFFLKPMNCPHHMQIFADNQFSYRDMPIRYFEPATVYRDEKTGQLSWLTRVRSITQDDGHLFCRVNQITEEVWVIVSIIKQFYTTMWMLDWYWVRLSIRWPEWKYLWSDEVWEKAEWALRTAADKYELPYKIWVWEAAFYGPKLDFMFKDAIGREWQLATIQCDFNLPERFDLAYTNENGEQERPVVIHRAISGSLERFMWVMIEHFAWIFPLWLSPRQISIVPVWENFIEYWDKIYKELKELGFRVTLDDSADSLNKKVRNAEKIHINYILVVWEQEQTNWTVSVRNYKTKEQNTLKVSSFIKEITQEILQKKI